MSRTDQAILTELAAITRRAAPAGTSCLSRVPQPRPASGSLLGPARHLRHVGRDPASGVRSPSRSCTAALPVNS